MGIQGLLPLLKSIHHPTHLRAFAGQTLGIDAYGWLHRGTVACCIELAQALPTRRHIDFCLHRVRMLIHFGVTPYLVFDGDYLPSKSHTEKDRAARRKESKRAGLEYLRLGKASQAQQELQKAVDVTPLMARELIEELKLLNVSYVVAPYEADSQLAYLEKRGTIDGIISEDSDLLVFGAKVLLTKLDQHGECVAISRKDFTACRDISLVGWTDREFRVMTMLSGCDYLPGIGNMGLKTAYRLVRKHKAVDRILRMVQFDGKMKVPAGYLEAFERAERTFLYQWVFDAETKELVNLNPVPADIDVKEMPYIGHPTTSKEACGVASGDLDPNTKKPLILPPRQYQQQRHHHLGSRSHSAQTPDNKPGVSIAEFFKPKRTPLAELDPNSFTPSPSQQTLLQSQPPGPSWSASQIPVITHAGIHTTRRVTHPAEITSSAPQPMRRTVSEQTRASPKRQRLCSDAGLAASMGGEVGTSRFFGASVGSPLVKKTRRRGKADEFDLWSDDSAAEAVAALTATPEERQEEVGAAASDAQPGGTAGEVRRKRKKIAVFTDDATSTAMGSGSFGDVSQATATSTAASTLSQNTAVTTPSTSFESTSVQRPGAVFRAGISASFARMKEQWAFDASMAPRPRVGKTAEEARPARRSGAVKVRQGSRTQRGPVMSLEPVIDNEDRPEGSDEIEREEEDVIPASSPLGPDSNRFRYSADNDDDDDEHFHDDSARTRRPPLRDAAKSMIEIEAKGSEDLLVPESPASRSCSEEDGGVGRPRIYFERFAFVG